MAVATLYAPQPLLHTLAVQFGLEKTGASLAVTLTMLPLSIAPILYGLLLESVPAGRLAFWALCVIGVGHLGVALSVSWPMVLGFRLLQGLAVPAVLTSAMTMLSTRAEPEKMRRVMALYIVSTIFGGFFGRFGSGLSAWAWGWNVPFMILAGLTMACAWLIFKTGNGSSAGFERPQWSKVGQALKRSDLRQVYMMIFCGFFVFSAALNFLPFRLAELEPGASELRTGCLYLGYLVGIGAALLSTRFCEEFGEVRTLRMGLVLFGMGVAGCLLPSGDALLFALFPFCAGFFLVQSVGPG